MKQWSVTTRFVTLQNVRIGQFRSHCAGWTHLRGYDEHLARLIYFGQKLSKRKQLFSSLRTIGFSCEKISDACNAWEGSVGSKGQSYNATIHRPFCAAARFTNNDRHIDTVANIYRKLRLRFLLHWHKDTFLSSFIVLKGRVRGLVGRGLKKSFPVTQSVKMLDPPLLELTYKSVHWYWIERWVALSFNVLRFTS